MDEPKPVCEMTDAMMDAGQRYLNEKSLNGRFTLPGCFNWHEFWRAVLDASPAAGGVDAVAVVRRIRETALDHNLDEHHVLSETEAADMLASLSPAPTSGSAGFKAVSDNGKRWRIVPDEGDWEMQPIGHVTAEEAKVICEGFVGLIRDRDRFVRLWNEERNRTSGSEAAGEAVTAALEAADAVLTGEDACALDPIVGSDNPHEHAAGLVREALRVREATRPHATDPGHWRWRGE